MFQYFPVAGACLGHALCAPLRKAHSVARAPALEYEEVSAKRDLEDRAPDLSVADNTPEILSPEPHPPVVCVLYDQGLDPPGAGNLLGYYRLGKPNAVTGAVQPFPQFIGGKLELPTLPGSEIVVFAGDGLQVRVVLLPYLP